MKRGSEVRTKEEQRKIAFFGNEQRHLLDFTQVGIVQKKISRGSACTGRTYIFLTCFDGRHHRIGQTATRTVYCCR